LCGVERERDFVLDETGAAHWKIGWRPIASPLSLVEAA
jgi:hypothetical protein